MGINYNKGKQALFWHIAVAAVVFAALLTIVVPGESQAAISVTRVVPATVSPGQTFDVTINFASPANNFNSIGITDNAPAGWNAQANISMCTPPAMESRVNGNIVDYIWAGPYAQNTAFKAVYKVIVPAGVAAGSYSFSGTLQSFVGSTGPTTDPITVTAQVQVTAAGQTPPQTTTPPATQGPTIPPPATQPPKPTTPAPAASPAPKPTATATPLPALSPAPAPKPAPAPAPSPKVTTPAQSPAPSPAASPAPSKTGSSDGQTDWVLIIGGIGGAIVMIIVIVLFLRLKAGW